MAVFAFDNGLEYGCEVREFDRERVTLQYESDVVQCQRDAAEEVVFAFEIATVSVGSQSLEYTDKHIAIEALAEFVFIDAILADHALDVMRQKLLTDGFGEIAFRAVEQRSGIVLGCASPGSLEIDII